MSNKKVSVIMSAYNAEKSIEKTMSSLLMQTYKNLEIIIADDGSTDRTYELLENFSQNNKNISLIKNSENLGLTKSLNILLGLAKGYYIARQDADDYSNTKRISNQVRFITKHKLDAVTCRAQVINENRTIPSFSYYLPKKILINYKNPYIHGTLLIKKRVINEMNNYDENFYFAQDYKLMSDLHKSNKKIRIMKDKLYYLNMKNNISTNNWQEQKYYADCVRNKSIPSL